MPGWTAESRRKAWITRKQQAQYNERRGGFVRIESLNLQLTPDEWDFANESTMVEARRWRFMFRVLLHWPTDFPPLFMLVPDTIALREAYKQEQARL